MKTRNAYCEHCEKEDCTVSQQDDTICQECYDRIERMCYDPMEHARNAVACRDNINSFAGHAMMIEFLFPHLTTQQVSDIAKDANYGTYSNVGWRHQQIRA